MRRRCALRCQQVNGLGATVLDVGARGVEVCIVVHQPAAPGLPAADHHLHQDSFARPALMGGQDVAHPSELLDHLQKPIVA